MPKVMQPSFHPTIGSTAAKLGLSQLESTVHQAYSSILAAVLGPFLQATGYRTASLVPNTIPDIGTLFTLYIAGLITKEHYVKLMGFHGVDITKEEGSSRQAWRGVEKLARGRLSVHEAIHGYRIGIVTTPDYKETLRLHGFEEDFYDRYYQLHAEYPAVIQLIEMLNRGIIDNHDFQDILKMKGYFGRDSIKQLQALRAYVPSPQDVIHFTVREVYNKEQRENLDLDAEYDENKLALPWFAMAGMGEQEYVNPLTGEKFTRDVARDYWAAHWQYIGMGQLFEMYHRLRPGEVDNKVAVVLTKDDKQNVPGDNSKVLTVDSYLKAMDIAPFLRERLALISRPPLGRIDLRRSWRVKAITDPKVLISKFQDLGYDLPNATIQANTVILEEGRTLTKIATRSTFSTIRNLYRDGVIEKSEVRDAFIKAGLSPEQADLTTARVLLEIKGKRHENNLKYLKRRFLKYDEEDEAIYQTLATMLRGHERLDEIWEDWNFERNSKSKELTASQLVKYFENDLISDEELLKKLKRIGYSDDDAILILDNAEVEKGRREIHKVETREAAKLRAMKRVSRSELQRWLFNKTISPEQARVRFKALGYQEDDIERYIREAITAREQWESEQGQAGKTPQEQGNGAAMPIP